MCGYCNLADTTITPPLHHHYTTHLPGGMDDGEKQCAYDISVHCRTDDGKKDPGCKGMQCSSVMGCKSDDATCLCANPDFAGYFDGLGMCERAKCLEYQHMLTTIYAKKGFYQPGEVWMERMLRFKNALLYEEGAKPAISFALSGFSEDYHGKK